MQRGSGCRLLGGAALLALAHGSAAAQPAPADEPVQVRLTAHGHDADRRTVAIRFIVAPGWYISAPEPGDFGLPTSIEWRLPPGVVVSPVQWPAAATKEAAGARYHVYEDSVTAIVELTADRRLTAADTLRARVRWGACSDVCVPGTAQVVLPLVGPGRERRQ